MKNALERQYVELEKQLEETRDDCREMSSKLFETQLEIQFLKGMLAGLGHPVEKVDPHDDSEMENSEDCHCPACREHDREEMAAKKKLSPEKIRNLNQSSKDIQKWSKENDVEVGKGDASDN
tara:strand:+ start:122 stop:487 length:366 start_codon:yes stop_codon:yes gene_type:complete